MRAVAENRKARYLYEVLDTLEAGLELKGTEVKSLRGHMINMTDAFCKGQNGEMWIFNLHISPYDFGNLNNHDPKRQRRLLLHKREALRWSSLSEQRGLTIVPLRVYFNDKSRAKVEIALVKSKKIYDRRHDIQEREEERELRRVTKYQ
ncbi:MAG: SsrA-binding protein SmpB [Candidatus Atribacteria bacterium]|nr:SsrA-binding protein SmpB [Candidatus Atribacteria bacterium]